MHLRHYLIRAGTFKSKKFVTRVTPCAKCHAVLFPNGRMAYQERNWRLRRMITQSGGTGSLMPESQRERLILLVRSVWMFQFRNGSGSSLVSGVQYNKMIRTKPHCSYAGSSLELRATPLLPAGKASPAFSFRYFDGGPMGTAPGGT